VPHRVPARRHGLLLPARAGATLAARVEAQPGHHHEHVAGVRVDRHPLARAGLADGRAASQEIFHVHLHVFPRYEGDPFGLVADWTIHPPREELDRVASEIQRAYDALWRESGEWMGGGC
jgi:hypothetical protein